MQIKNPELKTLNYLNRVGYKWLARNKDGVVCAFTNRPYKDGNWWFGGIYGRTNRDLFQEIKWEDDAPKWIGDLIVVYNDKLKREREIEK